MHLKSGTKKQKQKSSCVDTNASISKRNLDIIHGNQNLRRVRSKKKQQQNPLLYKKKGAVSTTITSISSEKAVQSNNSRRRLIVDDDHEDLSQAIPAGNVTPSKLQEVQFELPETAAVSTTTIITRSSEKSVQSNSKGRRGLLVDDEREDLSQATPTGNDTSMSTALIAQELMQQSFEQNEVAPIQTPHY